MIYRSNEDKHAENYVSFSNDLVGIFALSLGASCLGFKHPQPFAWFFLFVSILWLFSKQSPITIQHFRRYRTFMDNLRLAWEIKTYLIGLVFLGVIALGYLTQESVYNFFGYPQ